MLGRYGVVGLHQDFLGWLAGQPVPQNPDDPVFPELFGRRSGGHKGLSTVFQGLIAEAKIENRPLRAGCTGKGHQTVALSFHSLRHGAASSVFNNASLREIARRVTGHAAGRVLDRYLHQDVEAIRAAVALIPRLPL
jgi:integrase